MGRSSRPLGLQCWTCRARRVRCDSQFPACSNCSKKNLDCLGYAQDKPVRWRPVRVPTGSRIPSSLVKDDDICPPSTAIETIQYYNNTIGRDVGAFYTAHALIPLSEWPNMSHVDRHILICLVKLHHLIQILPDDFHDLDALPLYKLDGTARDHVAALSHHQANALRLVQYEIQHSRTEIPNSQLFTHLVFLLECQIQQGGCGMLHAHLNGAKALLGQWERGNQLVVDDMHQYTIISVDIYRTTTAASSELSRQVCDQHIQYLEIVPNLTLNSVLNSLAPIPLELIHAAVLINISRSSSLTDRADKNNGVSTAAILNDIQSFSPEAWAENVMIHFRSVRNTKELSSPDKRDIIALAQCFQSATMLYFLLASLPANIDLLGDDVCLEKRTKAYQTLVEAITYLFRRRQDDFASSRLHKFIAWPMVIAGVEAVVTYHDYHQADCMSKWLKLLTLELGTMTMRQAARFLGRLCADYKVREITYRYKGHTDWDEMFHDGPMFLY